DEGVQADLHQVDAGQRDHHVPREHHAAAEQPVEQVHQGDLPARRVERGAARLGGGAHRCSSIAKEYGGHGPDVAISDSGKRAWSPLTASSNAAVSPSPTRNAALSVIVPWCPLRRGSWAGRRRPATA